ncbi:glycosyltransferase [Microbacterium sp. M3]|uniref:Glycosyltransferase n=1 Tax=Microbacterium arthrosphaerae TaxID=792652 RepID=A0ABU4H2P4_9MICO|nr:MULTISPECIES: glycosyltransferase [Microbacterium]MDW4573606.1 glycosyltransferase [Microbacterium arthrosphaerae]MDW7607461.1 glycosyltransferase [Microbacterium sp. M3]
MNSTRESFVVVSAGTYHLPFDRLSEWMQRWHDEHADVRLLVQHGPSKPVEGAENVALLPYSELLARCAEADVVVLQGGAGGVMDMRALQIVPVVVPRVPGGGEVVDDHQLVFTSEMARLGLIRRATTYDDLASHLASALGRRVSSGPPTAEVATPGAHRVDELLSRPVRKLPWPFLVRRLARSGRALLAARFTRSVR